MGPEDAAEDVDMGHISTNKGHKTTTFRTLKPHFTTKNYSKIGKKRPIFLI